MALARQTLKEAGFDANLVSLLVDDSGTPVAKDVAVKPDIRLIDCAGRSEYGEWFEENARQAQCPAQKSGVNCVVVESTDDYKGMLRNLAVTLSLHSGQTAMTPRTILVSSEGIKTPEGTHAPEQFGRDLSLAISALLEDNARAVEVLGAIQSPAHRDPHRRNARTRRRVGADPARFFARCSIRSGRKRGCIRRCCCASRSPTARSTRKSGSARSAASSRRRRPRKASPSPSASCAKQGAVTFLVYSTNPVMQQLAEEVAIRAGVGLSFNLTGGLFVTQSAAFSDYHGTGVNPAASASLVDAAFVTSRFHVVQSRRHAV